MSATPPAAEPNLSLGDPYATGRYFGDSTRHGDDAAFKAGEFLKLFMRTMPPKRTTVRSYVDVGTGSGDAVHLIARGRLPAGL